MVSGLLGTHGHPGFTDENTVQEGEVVTPAGRLEVPLTETRAPELKLNVKQGMRESLKIYIFLN